MSLWLLKAELQMDVLRERQVKDSLERQLQDERKMSVSYQKRFKKERRVRKQIQDQLDLEVKRRTQLEEALKATGATPEQVRAITESLMEFNEMERKSRQHSTAERDQVKSPLQESRTGYYKNSVLFTSAT
ncbi:dachshund homolog 1-like [Copidosoma floridanum]|uniref:dachshund homolog 1-like n=1 Tax=Copidosoma floridanum TaxID=29053 RepID=UPI000C6F99D4|nr:dachshund homolog 1-like [Copidosoma floridanum]